MTSKKKEIYSKKFKFFFFIFKPFQQIFFVHHPLIDQLPLNNNFIKSILSKTFYWSIHIYLPLYFCICSNIFSIPKSSVSITINSNKLSIFLFHQGSNVTILRTLMVYHSNIIKDREERKKSNQKRWGKEPHVSISTSLISKEKKERTNTK